MGLFNAIFGGGASSPPPEVRQALRDVGRIDRNRALRRETAGLNNRRGEAERDVPWWRR